MTMLSLCYRPVAPTAPLAELEEDLHPDGGARRVGAERDALVLEMAERGALQNIEVLEMAERGELWERDALEMAERGELWERDAEEMAERGELWKRDADEERGELFVRFFPPHPSWSHLLHSHTIFPCNPPTLSLTYLWQYLWQYL